MINTESLVTFFVEKPYLFKKGLAYLKNKFDATAAQIAFARKAARSRMVYDKKESGAKILLLDIETAPIEAYVWQNQIWNAQIKSENIISDWFILSWSAKWLFDKTVHSMVCTGDEAIIEDDSRIVDGLWKILNEADIVIAHNGKAFDVKNIKTRFILNGMKPPKPFQIIDTLKIVQNIFGFTHNSLNALAKKFDLPTKLDTDYTLWKKCRCGDDTALKYMEKYNRGDVLILEQVYLKILPWITNHPNLSLYRDFYKMACPNCGSKEVVLDGYFYTTNTKYNLIKCNACGARGRQMKSKPLSKRDGIKSLV